jgi:hypothetical protein
MEIIYDKEFYFFSLLYDVYYFLTNKLLDLYLNNINIQDIIFIKFTSFNFISFFINFKYIKKI